MRNLRVICLSASAALAIFGLASLAVSLLTTEHDDGFYVEIGSHRLLLPSSGMLGDAGTYFTEWAMLGLFCLGAATLTILLLRVDRRASRRLVMTLLAFALAMVFQFATNVLVL